MVINLTNKQLLKLPRFYDYLSRKNITIANMTDEVGSVYLQNILQTDTTKGKHI